MALDSIAVGYKAMVCTMAIRVVEFSSGGTKLERILPKNQHTQRKLLNFENWVNGEMSNIGHNFKKCAPKLIFFNEKKN